MKRVLLSLTALATVLTARAEIEILYLAPNDSAPVLGSISSDSEAYKSAKPVDGDGNWMEIVRKDYYSGFIAKDSLTSDGTVEIGTAMLLTPSKSGRVLTTIEAGDEVSINLVDDWTEITVHKAIPGYFIPADRKVTPPSNVPLSDNRRVTYARDPLLVRAGNTRYSSSVASDAVTSGPIANQPTIPTSEPMTGFEEVDSLNPAFGRTAPDGQTRGYTLGAGSTPIPERDTTAPFMDTSMEAPTSVAAIPVPTARNMNPTITPPTQAVEVDAIEGSEDSAIESTPDESTDIEAVIDPELPLAEENATTAMNTQEEAIDELESNSQDDGIVDESGMIEAVEEDIANDDDDSEVIPLAPAAAV
ncbi:MAG: hypothetical protein ACQKBT_11825, partial [Puniceicoccales bacterium]